MKTQALGLYIAALEERAAMVDNLLDYIGALEAVGAQVEADLLLTDRVYRDLSWLHKQEIEAHSRTKEALQTEQAARAVAAQKAQDAQRQAIAASLANGGAAAGIVQDSAGTSRALDALAQREELERLRKEVRALQIENDALRSEVKALTVRASGRRIEVYMRPAAGG